MELPLISSSNFSKHFSSFSLSSGISKANDSSPSSLSRSIFLAFLPKIKNTHQLKTQTQQNPTFIFIGNQESNNNRGLDFLREILDNFDRVSSTISKVGSSSESSGEQKSSNRNSPLSSCVEALSLILAMRLIGNWWVWAFLGREEGDCRNFGEILFLGDDRFRLYLKFELHFFFFFWEIASRDLIQNIYAHTSLEKNKMLKITCIQASIHVHPWQYFTHHLHSFLPFLTFSVIIFSTPF